MKLKDVSILSATFGLKKISIKYYDNRFGQNRSAEEVDYPQPDLINAKDELRKDLANAFYSSSRDTEEKFSVKGFTISEKDDVKTVEISGLIENPHNYLDKVVGKIPLNEDQADLVLKLETLKMELYKFIFEAKTAEGKISGFDEPKDEEEKINGKSNIPKSKQIEEFDSNEPPTREGSSELATADTSGNGEEA